MAGDVQHTHLAAVLAFDTLGGARLGALLGDVLLRATVATALLA